MEKTLENLTYAEIKSVIDRLRILGVKTEFRVQPITIAPVKPARSKEFETYVKDFRKNHPNAVHLSARAKRKILNKYYETHTEHPPNVFSEENVKKVAKLMYNAAHQPRYVEWEELSERSRIDEVYDEIGKDKWMTDARSLLASLNLKNETGIRADERRKCEQEWLSKVVKQGEEAYAKGKADEINRRNTIINMHDAVKDAKAEGYAKGNVDLMVKATKKIDELLKLREDALEAAQDCNLIELQDKLIPQIEDIKWCKNVIRKLEGEKDG